MSDFNLNIGTLTPIFEDHGFKCVESYTNYARFESEFISIAIIHDKREMSNLLSIGELNGDLHFLDSEILKHIFNYDMGKIRPKEFSKFWTDFLLTEGKGILTGDLNKIKELNNYQNKRAKKYTTDLIRDQNLRAANQAWDQMDYLLFIKHIDLLDKDSLPKSYALKHKIAWDRIRGKN